MGDPERVLDLSSLSKGFPCITSSFGNVLAEAGRVCLDERRHPSPIDLCVDGSFSGTFHLLWEAVTEQMRRTYNDAQVATEHGAYGVACLLIRELTGLKVIERSCKGNGFDYWLGDDEGDLPFQNKARLEVSGIRQGDASKTAARVMQKRRQTERSDGTSLPAYVVVVEFGTPLARVVEK